MRRYFLAAVLLLLCLFAQAMVHARSASLTFDEGPHLAIGYATLRTGDLRLQPVHIHPPLANVLAAAPLLLQHDLPDPRTVGGWEIASLSAITDALVWQYPDPWRMALAGRFPVILLTLLLGAIVCRWAADLSGPQAGLLALFLCAFDPNIIAHGSLITTDMAVVLWGTMALFLTWRYLRGEGDHKGRPYIIGAGVALGLALGSKVSALSLVPVLGLLWLMGPRRLALRRRLLSTAGAAVLAALTLWAVYGFEVRWLPGMPFPLPAATHIAIYRSLQEHYALGHPAFLLGQNRDHGWWYYFPVAFVLKTPLPVLLLLVAAIAFRISELVSRRILAWQSTIRRWGPLVLFPVIYALSSFFSSVNIGYRHLLPLLPFVFIIASGMAEHGTRNTKHGTRNTKHGTRNTKHGTRNTKHGTRNTKHGTRNTKHGTRNTKHVLCIACCVLRIACCVLRIACCVFCLAWLALRTLLIAPHYLACFNVPDGYRYLVDSNLDWGQNLWQLHDWMQEHGVERVYYAHFSPARPEVYGIQVDMLPPSPRAVPFAPLDPAPGTYAIGATVLQGVYTPDVNTYAWFRTHEPVIRLGRALFVYQVEPRPAPSWAAVCADPAAVVSPETVRDGLGHTDLRVVVFDCRQAWVYPAGEGPGVFVLPPDVEPPPGATLEVQARHADGRPLYTVYRVENVAAPEHTTDVAMDGPLDFLGYRIDGYDHHPGDEIEFWTFWRVKGIPTRPLSLMAHLTGPGGVPIAVGDGLGVPIEQWQRGDVIAQRHRLPTTEETPPGQYVLQTGAYWLDTMERWPVPLAYGTGGDYIILASVEVKE